MEVILEIKKLTNKNDTIRFLNEIVKMAKRNKFSIMKIFWKIGPQFGGMFLGCIIPWILFGKFMSM